MALLVEDLKGCQSIVISRSDSGPRVSRHAAAGYERNENGITFIAQQANIKTKVLAIKLMVIQAPNCDEVNLGQHSVVQMTLGR